MPAFIEFSPKATSEKRQVLLNEFEVYDEKVPDMKRVPPPTGGGDEGEGSWRLAVLGAARLARAGGVGAAVAIANT